MQVSGGEVFHIKVMTPCYGGLLSTKYVESLLGLMVFCRERDFGLDWDLRDGGADVACARAECVGDFLKDSQATHLLFVDSDIGFSPEQVFQLLNFGAEFTAAAYPLKGLFWDRIATAVRDLETNPAATFRYALAWAENDALLARNEFRQAGYVGLGFVLLRRSALIKLAAADAATAPSSPGTDRQPVPERGRPTGLFNSVIEPDTGLYLSECFSFCRRWRELGGEIWVDLHSELTHVGPMPFRGDLFSQLEPVSEAEESRS